MAADSTDASAPRTNAQRMAELAALVDAVKERVRAQYPESTSNGSTGAICVGLPDLTPLSRARDAAAGKMAAIGTVNPRRGGLVNNSIQAVKRTVARALNWFVRDQVVFNRQMVTCIEACIESLADVNRTIHTLAGQCNAQIQQVRAEAEPLRVEASTLRAKTSDLQDLASHWHRWREEWQLKLHKNEVEFLKSVADLNAAVQQKIVYLESTSQQRFVQAEAALHQRVTGEEQNLREMHAAFERQVKELDSSYRETAKQLEAACQQAASTIQSGFHQTLLQAEASFGRRVSQVISDFDQRVTQMGQDVSISLQQQHDAFETLTNSNAQAATGQIAALDQRMATSMTDLQKQFYSDLNRIRTEYEQVIHAELRIVRQRLAAGAPGPALAKPAEGPTLLPFDYARFTDRFRGPEQYVTESQRFYLPYFAGRRRVLDAGCGRGEFLKLMQEAGVPSRGIESSQESAAYCRSLGLDVIHADLFAFLSAQPEGFLDGIFCSQVVEHLPADRLPELVRLCAGRLATGGVLAIETPNPECLAIFATHFYLDPTHTRPVPAQLLAFYMEEFGMGRIEVHRRAPAVESMPTVEELPHGFREKFFGGLDYAIIAYRL